MTNHSAIFREEMIEMRHEQRQTEAKRRTTETMQREADEAMRREAEEAMQREIAGTAEEAMRALQAELTAERER